MNLSWQRLSIYAIIYAEVIIMATMNVSLPDPMKEWVEDQSGAAYTAMPAIMCVT